MADEPHPQIRRVLEAMDRQPGPALSGRSVESARTMVRERFERPDEPDPVAHVDDFEIPGPDEPIPVRLYLPDADGPRPTVVYYHGGGFVVGDLDTIDPVCRALANESDCAVLSVAYRLAPEHPFPAAHRDAMAALSWAAEYATDLGADPARIAVAGDSAGGNLAASVGLMARDRGGPAVSHQLLFYPAVRSPVQEPFDSLAENAEGYFLERRDIEFFSELFHRDRTDYRNEYLWPLLAADLSGLPPATVVTAGFDPLRDEGRAFADRLREDGVDVTHRNYEEMVHGFVGMIDAVDRSREAVAFGADRLRSAFRE